MEVLLSEADPGETEPDRTAQTAEPQGDASQSDAVDPLTNAAWNPAVEGLEIRPEPAVESPTPDPTGRKCRDGSIACLVNVRLKKWRAGDSKKLPKDCGALGLLLGQRSVQLPASLRR